MVRVLKRGDVVMDPSKSTHTVHCLARGFDAEGLITFSWVTVETKSDLGLRMQFPLSEVKVVS